MHLTDMASEYIGLNVGGKVFLTSRTTLTRYQDSFFTVLLSDRFESAKDDRGNYLIDRDGELFRHVLNFLRCGKLMLPSGFSEYALLESEADFFQLDSLKEQVYSVTSESVALNIGGRIYHTTRQTLLREPNTFFTDMLNGTSRTPRDAHGHLIVEKEDVYFRPILNYLRSFHIQPINDLSELEILNREAWYYKLSILKEHIESVRLIHNLKKGYLLVHLYYYDSGTCTIYTNLQNTLKIGTTSFLPLSRADFQTICGAVRAVSFALDPKRAGTEAEESSGKVFVYPTCKSELVTYIAERLRIDLVEEVRLSAGCTRILLQRLSHVL